MLAPCNQKDWQKYDCKENIISTTLGFQDLALLNPERDLSNKCKDGFVFEICGNNIRLVMKAKGFFFFWMVERDYCLRWRVLNGKSFKGVKLQANRTSFGQEDI